MPQVAEPKSIEIIEAETTKEIRKLRKKLNNASFSVEINNRINALIDKILHEKDEDTRKELSVIAKTYANVMLN